MPSIFRGTVNGTQTGPTDNLPYKVISVILVNKGVGANTVNLTIKRDAIEFNVVPYNLAMTAPGTANSIYISDVSFYMFANEQLKITSSDSLGYYVSMDNIQPDEVKFN